MMLPAGVVQSIDANTVNLDQAWIYADQDIWSQDYGEVLLQPISIEAVDINDLRFQASEVVISIRANPDPMSQVLWSGWCETVDDPSGAIPDLGMRISCGVIDPVPPVFVDNGNGTASIFGFRCAIRPVPDYTESPLDFDIPAATLTFANNTESYVCVRYNAGAPVMYVESSQAAINGSDVVLIFVVWRTGNELHSISTDSRGIGLADKIAGMITRTQPYSLVHGQQLTLGVTTTPAVRTVTIAAATIYAGVDAIPLAAINSSNPAQRFTRVAPTAGVYGFVNQTQLDNTNYSDGTNVVAMAANRYSPRWVYRTVGDDAQAFYVLGNEYSNIASAQAAPLPTGLPLVVQDHAVLVGRIIVQNGIDTPVQIDQVVDVNFASSTANMHNNLDGLQGTGPDYYHMDVTRWTNTGNGPWLPLTAGIDKPLTGTLYGNAGAEFGSGALVLVTQGSGSTLAQTYTRGGDLSLAGNAGRANLRIMGSISADTAGVGPGLSFAGVSTGVGATGGGMLMQLATNNGLDVYSWNNTAWVKKSQINSAGMIAVVGGTAAGFLKANGTIDTTGYLTSINPTYTGRLTGPTQHLEADEQILLAIRRLGGQSGRIHGISFMAQNDASAWVEFGRVMTYISSVTAGAHAGGMRLMAYKNGAILQALDAGPDAVRVGAGLPLQMEFTTVIDASRNATFEQATLNKFGKFQELPGFPAYGALYGSNVTPGGFTYSLRIADDGSDAVLNGGTNVVLAVAGGSKVAVTASEMNLASGVALKMAATTVIDSSRNITGISLKATGLVAATVRPATIGTDGLLGAQDAAAFRTTIGAAASTDLAGYLPLTAGITKPLTGTLYGAGAELGGGALVLVQQGSGSTLAQTYTRGGDMSLAGDSGRANMRIMGSIQADTAGVGPGLSFAGVATGVGPTGGGMLMQLATNNGLDVYSWNNTAWIKKSQINSAGMIAVVGGTAAGFLKANGTIDTAGYLTSINPTYTGRLTGPEQYLENDGQILLAIRRPGGNSGRIHGIAFQAQTLNGTWAEFGRVMTYISSVADGAQTGGMRLMAYKDGVIVQALDAGPDGVTFGGTLSGPRATLTEFGTLAAMPGDSNYATLHATGVTRTASNYALRLADSGADTLVNAATNVALAIAGAAKLGVTSSNVNLGSGVSLSFSATTVIDSSRNAAFVGLTTTGNPTFGSTTGSSSIHINSGAGTASSINFMDNSVTRATLQLYTSNVFRLVARDTAGTEIDSPIYIDLTAGGKITIGGTSRVTNFKNALEMNGVVFVDSSRNASFANLTTTGVTKISSTSGAYLYVDAGTGTASGVQMQYAGVTQAISRYIGPANTGTYQIVAYSGGSELDYPVSINMAAGGTISLNRNVSITGSLTASADITTSGDVYVGDNRKIQGRMATSDSWRITGIQNAADDGYLEIATADNGNESIVFRQYTGVFTSITRTLTLLDGSGNTQMPGDVTATRFVATSNGSGQNFRVGDDLWIGDVNESHTARLAGFSDSNQAFLKFGSSGPKLGYNGSTFSLSTGMSFFGDVAINGSVRAGSNNVAMMTNWAGGNAAVFCYSSYNTSSGYGMIQDLSGLTRLNSASQVEICNAGTANIVVTSAGIHTRKQIRIGGNDGGSSIYPGMLVSSPIDWANANTNESYYMVPSSGLTLPTPVARRMVFLEGQSSGPVTNQIRVPSGVSWGVRYRDASTGERLYIGAGQSLDVYSMAGFLVGGNDGDWHLLLV